jgi:aspartate-semialdehyde dehydrogenase
MNELIPIKGKLGASNRIKQPSMVTIQAISYAGFRPLLSAMSGTTM